MERGDEMGGKLERVIYKWEWMGNKEGKGWNEVEENEVFITIYLHGLFK